MYHATSRALRLYNEGKGVAKSPEKAFAWFRKSADNNNADAQYQVGLNYEHGIGVNVDSRKAIEFFTKAGNNGVPAAFFELGLMLTVKLVEAYCFIW